MTKYPPESHANRTTSSAIMWWQLTRNYSRIPDRQWTLDGLWYGHLTNLDMWHKSTTKQHKLKPNKISSDITRGKHLVQKTKSLVEIGRFACESWVSKTEFSWYSHLRLNKIVNYGVKFNESYIKTELIWSYFPRIIQICITIPFVIADFRCKADN